MWKEAIDQQKGPHVLLDEQPVTIRKGVARIEIPGEYMAYLEQIAVMQKESWGDSMPDTL